MHLAVSRGAGDAGRVGFWAEHAQKLVWRARIVLLSADGIGTMTIVRLVGKSKVTVWRWQERYLAKGIAGLRRMRRDRDASRR